MKKVTHIIPLAALFTFTAVPATQAQTTLTGDHIVTGNLTVEGAGGTTIDHDLQVSGTALELGTWSSTTALLIEADTTATPAKIIFSGSATDTLFSWETDGAGTPFELMKLTEDGVLTLFDSGSSNTIVLDPALSTVTINGSEVVTQSPSGIINVDGVNELALGSVTTPAISFASDADTGIYSPVANKISFVAGGKSVLTLTSDGRIGMGTDDPDGALSYIGNDIIQFNGVQELPAYSTGDQHHFRFYPGLGALRTGYYNAANLDESVIGLRSTSIGANNIVTGKYYSTAIGENNILPGHSTLAIGADNSITGSWVNIAIGYDNEIAASFRNIAIGNYNDITSNGGSDAYVFGKLNTADAAETLAMGIMSFAAGDRSITLGTGAIANTYQSIVIGSYNDPLPVSTSGATTWYNLDELFVVGNGTGEDLGGSVLDASNAIVTLKTGETTLINRHWDDQNPAATPADPDLGTTEHEASEGRALVVKGHAEFEGNITLQDGTVINGADDLQTAVLASSSGGSLISADSSNRVAIGDNHTVNGANAMVWGDSNTATHNRSTAWGFSNEAIGSHATAWGYNTDATDTHATAWGDNTAANDVSSTAWGNRTTASGEESTAWGYYSIASGFRSTAWGARSNAEANNSTALGRFNVGGFITIADGDDTNDGDTQWFELDPLFEIGIGTSITERANAVTVLKNGQTTLENKYWDDQAPTAIPADPDLGTTEHEASEGHALVVKGHTELEGNLAVAGDMNLTGSVTLAQRPGDVLMGDFGL